MKILVVVEGTPVGNLGERAAAFTNSSENPCRFLIILVGLDFGTFKMSIFRQTCRKTIGNRDQRPMAFSKSSENPCRCLMFL